MVWDSARMECGPKQQKAFNNLKLYLQQLPTLSCSWLGQSLILYISATHSAVSGSLVVEKEVTKNDKTMKQ
jgi:hypothetical protein